MEVFQILSFAPEGVVGPLKEKANLQKSVREMESIILKALSQSLHEEEKYIFLVCQMYQFPLIVVKIDLRGF